VIKSPCKSCEKHKKIFPQCIDKCKILNEIREVMCNTQNDIRTNYEYEISDNVTIVYNFTKRQV